MEDEVNDNGQKLVKPDISIKAMLVEEGHSILNFEGVEQRKPFFKNNASDFPNIIIIDETQNATIEEMNAILGRIPPQKMVLKD